LRSFGKVDVSTLRGREGHIEFELVEFELVEFELARDGLKAVSGKSRP
jgi:hypothetical protein